MVLGEGVQAETLSPTFKGKLSHANNAEVEVRVFKSNYISRKVVNLKKINLKKQKD